MGTRKRGVGKFTHVRMSGVNGKLVKFFVNVTGSIVKIAVIIIIFLLTVVGIVSLIFPVSRNELIHQLMITLSELRHFIGI